MDVALYSTMLLLCDTMLYNTISNKALMKLHFSIFIICASSELGWRDGIEHVRIVCFVSQFVYMIFDINKI